MVDNRWQTGKIAIAHSLSAHRQGVGSGKALPEPFVASIEEGLIAKNGATYREPKLISVKWRIRHGAGKSGIFRCKRLVPIELEDRSVKIVGSGFGNNRDRR